MNKINFDDGEGGYKENSHKNENVGIVSTGDVMPEAIYLGLKGGANQKLVSAGQKLPFEDKPINGFTISKGQKEILIPIMRKTQSGYETIASGKIFFKNIYTDNTNVSVKFSVNRNQLLTFEAWTSTDNAGIDVIEKGMVELNIGDITGNKNIAKMSAPSGVDVPVKSTMAQLKNLCCNDLKMAERTKNKMQKQKTRNNILKKIKEQKQLLLRAGNPQEFAGTILKDLNTETNKDYIHTLLPVARKITEFWSDEERHDLADKCKRILTSSQSVLGFNSDNHDVQINIEAIMTLGKVGNVEHISILRTFEDYPKYRSALLFAYGYAGERLNWIIDQFNNDYNNNRPVQDSLRAVGLVVLNSIDISDDDRKYVIDRLLNIIEDAYIQEHELAIALVALGYCCKNETHQSIIADANNVVNSLNKYYVPSVLEYISRAKRISLDLINKKEISAEDEKFLLRFLEN